MYYLYTMLKNENKISKYDLEKTLEEVLDDYMSFVIIGIRACVYDAKGNLICGREM